MFNFYTSLKTLENQRFSDVFRGYGLKKVKTAKACSEPFEATMMVSQVAS